MRGFFIGRLLGWLGEDWGVGGVVPGSVARLLRDVGRFRVRFLVAGFSGWPDAGNVSTLTVGYLKDKLEAEKIWEMGGEEFYTLTSTRPYVRISGGVIRDLKPPTTELYRWLSPMGDKALLILIGGEPSINWGLYVERILGVCSEAGITKIYMVGGVLDSVPHTRRPRISAVVNMEHLREEVRLFGLRPSEYNGPSSIHSYLMMKAKERGIEAVGIWGHAPSYVNMPNTMVALHVLRKLTGILGVEVDMDEMEENARELEMEVERMVSENPELQRLVKVLEKSYEEEEGSPSYIS